MRKYGQLVKVVAPDTPIYTEIYRLSRTPQGIFNGDFSQWLTAEDELQPLGWQPINNVDEGDETGVFQGSADGQDCLVLYVYENGVAAPDSAFVYSGVAQQGVTFPETLGFRAMPTEVTIPAATLPNGDSVHLRDDQGHDLVIGFSDRITQPEIIRTEDGLQVMYLLPASLGQWSDFNLDIGAMWDEAGWTRPLKLDIYLVVSTNAASPGVHNFYVADIY